MARHTYQCRAALVGACLDDQVRLEAYDELLEDDGVKWVLLREGAKPREPVEERTLLEEEVEHEEHRILVHVFRVERPARRVEEVGASEVWQPDATLLALTSRELTRDIIHSPPLGDRIAQIVVRHTSWRALLTVQSLRLTLELQILCLHILVRG